MHLALDRQEMAGTLTFGLGLMNPPGMNGGRKGGWSLSQEELSKLPGYRVGKHQDLAEAKRLLAEAGYPNGFRFLFAFNSGTTGRLGEAQVLAAHLAKIGVQVQLQPKEEAVARKLELDDDFVSTFAGFTYDPDGSDWPVSLHSKQAKARAGIDDPELDRLLDAQGVELDDSGLKCSVALGFVMKALTYLENNGELGRPCVY